VTAVRRQVLLILLGVGALTLGCVVLALSGDWAEHLLAVGLVVGGIAMVVVALPTRNGG
jgi:hypothetical protein